MATARLVPSTYYLSNSSYLSVSNESNMYTNTDSTTYGNITHNRASTYYTYYVYIRGFNFDDVPSNATVNSFTVKIKAKATGHTTSTSSSYYMYLIDGTTQIDSTNASGRLSTNITTFTFANGSLTWSQVVGYGASFGIRIPLKRANSNTEDVVSVYGAEILVDYTVPTTTYAVTATTPTGISATIEDNQGNPSPFEAGSTVDVWIDGTDFTGLNVTDNGVDVTSSCIYTPPDQYYPYGYYYYQITNIQAAHTIVISRMYTVSVSTSASGLTLTLGDTNSNIGNPLTVEAGGGVSLLISGSNLNGISITDNGTDVTSSLVTQSPGLVYTINSVQSDHTLVVSQVITYSITASTSLSGVTLTLYDIYGNASGTSMNVTAGDGGALVVAASDYSGIHLTDNGVDVTSSLLLYNNTRRYSFSNVQAAHTLVVTRATTYSVTASTSVSGWQVTVYDGSYETTQVEEGHTAYVDISGSNYTGIRVTDNGVDVTSSLVYDDSGNTPIYYYAISNVQAAHTIVVSQTSVSTYTISASTSASGLTLTLSSGGNSGNPLTVNEGSTVILTISGSNLTNLSITDNGVDATSSLVSNNGVTTYTISNVQAAHTLAVSQTFTPSTYTVRLVASEYTVSDSSKVTINNANYLYQNTDNTSGYATVQGPNNYTQYYFFLHGFNFSDVPENAIVTSFTVKIKGYRNNNNSSTSNYLTKAPSTSSGYISISGSNVISFQFSTSQQTLTLPTYDTTWRQLASCGSDFSIQLGVRSNSSSSACVYIYGAEIEVTYTLPFTISASSETARATIQPASQVIRPGKSAKVTLSSNRGIILKDNGVDVTSQIIQENPGYSYSVTNLTNPFGFFLNDDDYYESNTQNEHNSSACCRFDFHLAATGNISFSVINYSDVTGSDYGIFYKLDTTASTAYNTDISSSSSKVYWLGKDNNSASVQTVTYTGVSAGDHYIYIKYIKYSSTNQYNDSLQFKVASVTITGSYTPEYIYTYSLNSVQANHTIVVQQGIMVYDIAATTSSSGLTLEITDTTASTTGNPLTVTEGHTARLSISGSDLTDLTITDNGTDVTSSLTTVSGEKRYTLTNVQADHTLVVYQSFRITPSMNDNYPGIWLGVKQGNSETSAEYRDVDAGTTCYVQLNNNYTNYNLPQTGITATDNGVDVTSSLVYNTSSSYDFYSYTLTNVQTDHNVVFGYTGTYYTISASTNSNLTMYMGDESGTNISGKCFPGGSSDLFIIVQDSDLSLVHMTDNGVDVTSSLAYQPAHTYGSYTQPAYYMYVFSNVQENHNIVVSLQKIYLKINGSYVQMSKVYKKISNEWVEQTDYTTLFDNNHIYIHR